MKMIKAVVRPEKVNEVLSHLNDNGFPAATRMSILGRGKQQGLKVADVLYDEIPKEMILVVVKDEEAGKVQQLIIEAARTGKKGAYGDGKIFIIPVEKSITISSGAEEE